MQYPVGITRGIESKGALCTVHASGFPIRRNALRLHSVTPIAVRLPLSKPIKMAGITLTHAENLLVRIEDETGRVGWGEAASAPTMTGDLPSGLVAAVWYMKARLEGLEVDTLTEFSADLDGLMYGNHAAKSAIDIAVHDLMGHRLDLPVYALLGGAKRRDMPVLWILATAGAQSDIAEARAMADQGFSAFKIKVAAGPKADRVRRDLDRSGAVRMAIGHGHRLSADANQGYALDEALAFAKGATTAGLDFIEQPVRFDDLAGMRAVSTASGVPIGADEGLQCLADLERHHDHNAAQGGSFKILKFGGLQQVLQAAQRADELGMHVNLAGKVAETSIASAALTHLGAALPQIDWDISVTHQYLTTDILAEPLPIRLGRVAPPDRPGLGITVDEDRVRRFAYDPGKS